MIVKYSNEFPYWIYGDNKIATKNHLEMWLNRYGNDYDNSFKVNEISKDNVIVIGKNPNLKYIHITKENQNFYYYQTDIEFIANNTYKLIFNLDWYATYFLDLMVNDKLIGEKCFVKRSHHAITPNDLFQTCLFKDEKLDNVSPIYSKMVFVEDELTSFNVNGKTFYNYENNTNLGYELNNYKFINIYGMWKAQAVDNKEGYYILPVSNQINISNEDMFFYKKNTSSGYSISGFNNRMKKIREINKNSNWANGFVGIFTGPNFIYLNAGGEVKQIPNTNGASLIGRVFSDSYFHKLNITKPLFKYTGNQKLLLNHKDGLYSPNILNYLDIKIGNSRLDALNFKYVYDTNTNEYFLRIKDGYCSFNESSFSFYNEPTLDNFDEIVKTFPGPLMSESQPYLQYIEQNKNRLNTSLAISGVGMVGSLATSIATGNPLGLLGVMGGMKNIANTAANLNDKKKELLDKPNASYDNDNAFYWLAYLLNNIKSTSLVYYRNLENLAKYNNEILYYGWKQNKYLDFRLPNLNKHFFIQIDAMELFNRNPKLFINIPKNYIELILEMLNNGLRLWTSLEIIYELQ